MARPCDPGRRNELLQAAGIFIRAAAKIAGVHSISLLGFIKAHRHKHSVQVMCRLLGVAPSGYYAWLAQPMSDRAQEDARLLRLIRASFMASQGIYGAPRVFLDLREAGEGCSKHRVARLMREHQLRALHGYRMRRWSVGKPSVLIPKRIKKQIYKNRELALHDVADYIDRFYNATRRHSHLGGVSPEQFEAALKRR